MSHGSLQSKIEVQGELRSGNRLNPINDVQFDATSISFYSTNTQPTFEDVFVIGLKSNFANVGDPTIFVFFCVIDVVNANAANVAKRMTHEVPLGVKTGQF